MSSIFSLGYASYHLALRIASPFIPKASKWLKGRKRIQSDLSELKENDRVIWIHAASMGEYEMARPILNGLREKYPNHKLVVTFFSPSGYEARRNDPAHDFACYFPHDYKSSARQFLNLIHPEIAIFIKYEFWPNMMTECLRRDIPLAVVSATFRENHFVFGRFGKSIRNLLSKASLISVQDSKSLELLQKFGFSNAVLSGDPRFDNVIQLSKTEYSRPDLEKFIDFRTTLIAGSCWTEDEDVILPQIMSHTSLAFILVPHDISESNVSRLMNRLPAPAYRWSKRNEISNPEDYRILVVDTIGELRAMYSYSQMAFVGGGYKTGLHNILEPASYGKPVFFGPEHSKFWEAEAMIQAGGAFEIDNRKTLSSHLDKFIKQPAAMEEAGRNARTFVEKNAGAGETIIRLLSSYMS